MLSTEVEELARLLTDPARCVAVGRFPRAGDRTDEPGLYAWFVDAEGAAALSRGLATRVAPGLVYAGQAGAGSSSATLESRLLRNHLGGNIYGSTLRFTLAAVLARELGLRGAGGKALAADGEALLGAWMRAHSRVAVAAVPDRERLGALEDGVLVRLDPPLNLERMVTSPLRTMLTTRRRALAGAAQPTPIGVPPPPRNTPARRAPTTQTPGVERSGTAPDMAAHLRGLVGQTVPTMTGRPNTILGIVGSHVLVATGKSPGGARVDIADIQDAANRLHAEGSIEISVESVGHRSAFVGGVLSTLPGTRTELRPRRVIFGGLPMEEDSAT